MYLFICSFVSGPERHLNQCVCVCVCNDAENSALHHRNKLYF